MTRLLLPGAGKTEQLLVPASDYCQRWREQTHSWRHTSEGGFDRTRFEVAETTESLARPFVETHHYSKSYAGGSLAQYGLFARGGELVGVAVLGNGGFPAVLRNPFPELEPYTESSELARLVLLDEVPANAESWFLARVFELAAQGGMRGIVSFSDPKPRLNAQGAVVMPGHIGTIYQASNATYTGLGTARTIWRFADGTVFNEQNLGKIRLGKKGHEYAEAMLVERGAKPRGPRTSGKSWLPKALKQAGCTTDRHPGNHRYLFALGDKRQRRAVTFGFSAAAYPKKGAA